MNVERNVSEAHGVFVSATDTPHFAGLDALRGLAALTVVFFHMTWMNPTRHLGIVRNGYLMVDVFFVLSGFVIFYAYHGKLNAPGEVRRFLWLRFWRVYPIHFVFLIAFVLIEALKAVAEWYSGLHAHHPAFEQSNGPALIENLFLIQALVGRHIPSFNQPSWSISTEFFAYVVFAAVTFSLRKRGTVIIVSALLCAAAFGGLLELGPRALTLTFDFGIVRCIAGFFLGVLIYAIYARLRTTSFICQQQDACGLAAVMAMVAFVTYLSMKDQDYSDLGVYPLAGVVILLVAMSRDSYATRFLYSRPLQWLGAASYSVYMAQSAVLWFVVVFLRFGMHASEFGVPNSETMIIVTDMGTGTVAMIVAVALVLVTAQIAHVRIELPFRNWSRTVYVLRTRSMQTRGSDAS